jgi:hypothetical protein
MTRVGSPDELAKEHTMSHPDDMSGVSESHSPPSSRKRSSSGKPEQQRADETETAATDRTDRPATKYLTVTIDADSARVIRVEGQNASGTSHELTRDERRRLVSVGDDRLDDLLERAFEAGIACVLGGDADVDETQESPEDAQLRRELLAPLIKRSAVKRLRESGVLNRAIVNTLIESPAT